ncbi:MAG: fibronectin type III domain-containing protein [Ruminococcus sp.]|nr:fibronectin type III domain-containing protein [Ruminococcus sp.]
MKKLVSVILSILVICSSFAGLTAFADETNESTNSKTALSVGGELPTDESQLSGTIGECTWSFEKGSNIMFISGNGSMEQYDSYLDIPWYRWNENIEKVVIEEGVTVICRCAFNECKNLKEVSIADSVISIGFGAFCECESLKQVSISKNVSKIGATAFAGCKKLEKIEVDENNVCYSSINGDLYEDWYQMELKQYALGKPDTEFTIPDGVERIDMDAFAGSDNLVTVKIPKSVKEIAMNAFEKCTNLTEITIPDTVEEIDGFTFSGCNKLTKVVYGNGIKEIEGGTFYDCEGLTAFTIPNTVTKIDNHAFYGCINMKKITIPKSVTEIGEHALGYYFAYYDDASHDDKVEDFVIYGYKGTAGEKYALDNGFKFVSIGDARKTPKITGIKSQYLASAGKSFNLNAKANTKLSYTSSNKKVAVVYSSGRVAVKGVGSAVITIKASENRLYKSAVAKVKVFCAPKDFSSKEVSKVKKTGTKAKLSWKKLAGATGYTVQYATNKTFKKAKNVKVSKTTATITGLKKGKTYYARINAYAKISGKKYSNKWYTVKFKM